MKDLWIVVAGNVPVCIKDEGIFPITAFTNQSILIPIFDDFRKARHFADKVKRHNFIFASNVRIIRAEIIKGGFNESD